MAKYANQRTITVHSSSGGKRATDGSYGIITKKELQTACYVLEDERNSTPVLLFIALAMNQDGYPYGFSPAALESEYGISKKRWREAFKVLKNKGYLQDDGKNHYTFDSYPVQYRNISFIDGEQAQEESTDIEQPVPVDDENDSAVLPPTDIGTPTGIGTAADVHRVLPPTGIGTAADGYSNITNNTYTLQDNTDMDNGSESVYPEEIIDDRKDASTVSFESKRDSLLDEIKKDRRDAFTVSMESERDSLLDEIKKEFGFWDETAMEVENARTRSHTVLSKHVSELERVLKKLRGKREDKKRMDRYSYTTAIKKTMPQGDDWKTIGLQYYIELALDAWKKEYREKHNGRDCPPTWAVWLNGWNEELQKPNYVVAMGTLPLEVIAKQHHILDGIPKEYFESLKKR